MLQNEYVFATIGFDSVENEHFEVCPLYVYRSPRLAGKIWRRYWVAGSGDSLAG